MRSSVIAVAVVALGCTTSKPATTPVVENRPEPAASVAARPSPPPPKDRFEYMMRTAVTMFVAMGDAAEAGGSDCGKVSLGVDRVLDAHLGFIAEAKQLQKDPELKKRGEEWMAAHRDEYLASLSKFSAAVTHCIQDPAFAKVIERLQMLD